VLIGDDVEIGAGTTIDRGALGDTVIEDGVKLDNQIQVGHNVRIGAHTAMAGLRRHRRQRPIGARCTVGGGAAILGHLQIADDVNVAAGTLVTKSIPRRAPTAARCPCSNMATG
jgi:UDP-3-O-[3-hydroxymyristoyl] glucosamine N-acyltransferase